MQLLNSYVLLLGWIFAIAISSAVAFAIAVWIVDRLIIDTKALGRVMKKPLATAILLAAVIIGIAIIIASVC